MKYEYTNSTEYRNIFRKITGQTLTPPPTNPFEIDEETLDEQHYDEEIVTAFLDTIYNNTKQNSLFQQLYDLAAAQMISLNREIGLSVLFSYDYLAAFYACYCEYMQSPEIFTESTPSYVRVKNLL
jgi:hypothetical protein